MAGNAFELSSVPQEKYGRRHESSRGTPSPQRRIRHAALAVRGMAQQASMSTEEFEDFYFRTCLMDYAAPASRHAEAGAMMEKAEYVKNGRGHYGTILHGGGAEILPGISA